MLLASEFTTVSIFLSEFKIFISNVYKRFTTVFLLTNVWLDLECLITPEVLDVLSVSWKQWLEAEWDASWSLEQANIPGL